MSQNLSMNANENNINIASMLIKQGFLIEPSVVRLFNNLSADIVPLLKQIFLSVSKNSVFLTKDFFYKNYKAIQACLLAMKREQPALANYLDLFEKNLLQFISVDTSIEITEQKPSVEKQQQVNESSIIVEIRKKKQLPDHIKVLDSFHIGSKKLEVKDFLSFFKHRFIVFRDLLKQYNLPNLTTINKINSRNQNVSIIGLVADIRESKNKNLIIELEDLTGRISVLVNKDKDIYETAKQVVLDEVIAVKGVGNKEIIFASEIFFPEIAKPEVKKCNDDWNAVFIADTHIGSTEFLEQKFVKFIKWLNGEIGNDKVKQQAKKVKYLFIAGDLVEGVGIYPDQEDFLAIKDIVEQYKILAEYLSMVRPDINIIVIPGNHDAVRLIEPQPVFNQKFAKPLLDLDNVYAFPNPSTISVGVTDKFAGFNVLLYHGFSVHYFLDNVEMLRNQPESKIFPFLLRKRHLAPVHGSTLYYPSENDFLIIKKIPDIVVMGHLHKTFIEKYNGIYGVFASCWEGKTPEQERRGIEPDPAKALLFNSKKQSIRILDFS